MRTQSSLLFRDTSLSPSHHPVSPLPLHQASSLQSLPPYRFSGPSYLCSLPIPKSPSYQTHRTYPSLIVCSRWIPEAPSQTLPNPPKLRNVSEPSSLPSPSIPRTNPNQIRKRQAVPRNPPSLNVAVSNSFCPLPPPLTSCRVSTFYVHGVYTRDIRTNGAGVHSYPATLRYYFIAPASESSSGFGARGCFR